MRKVSRKNFLKNKKNQNDQFFSESKGRLIFSNEKKKNKRKRHPTGVVFSSLLLRNGLFKTWQENTHGASPTRRKSALNPLVLSPSSRAVLYHPSFAVL